MGLCFLTLNSIVVSLANNMPWQQAIDLKSLSTRESQHSYSTLHSTTNPNDIQSFISVYSISHFAFVGLHAKYLHVKSIVGHV